MDTLPAYDIAAEQALLGAVIAAPAEASAAFLTVPADGYWTERHRFLATVLHGRITRGEAIDPQLVLQATAGRKRAGDDIGPYIHTLYARAWSPANAHYYADRVRQLHAARRLLEVVQRATQQLHTFAENLDDIDLTAVTADLAAGADEVGGMTAPAAMPNPPTVLDLLAETETYDWLVPGLFERGERLMLTGGEGTGKSMAITQVAACFAGGVHPFSRRAISPLRVAVVDCENPRALARRRYRTMVPLVEAIRNEACLTPPEWQERLFIDFRPEGLNLLAARDVAWLESFCAATAPDVLVLGPIYKLHTTNLNDETAARELTRVLDSIRTRHRCALIMEAHAGNAEDGAGRRAMRPRGSALFRGWPEFGYGLVRGKESEGEHPNIVDMVAWRGSREGRDWPRQLQHGQTLPWIPHGDYRPSRHLEIA